MSTGVNAVPIKESPSSEGEYDDIFMNYPWDLTPILTMFVNSTKQYISRKKSFIDKVRLTSPSR